MSVQTQIIAIPGAINVNDGVNTPVRAGRQGDLIVSELHGKNYEQAFRKNLFILDSDSVTLAAAHTTKGALATVKFVNGFYNPVGSGVNAAIISSLVGTVSGTPAGPFFYDYITGITATSAATGTIRNGLLGSQSSSLMVPQVSVVLAIQGGGTTALTQLATCGGPAAIAAGAGIYSSFDLVDGKIIVPPGAFFGICAAGAGTTHVVQSTLTWEEVPI